MGTGVKVEKVEPKVDRVVGTLQKYEILWKIVTTNNHNTRLKEDHRKVIRVW